MCEHATRSSTPPNGDTAISISGSSIAIMSRFARATMELLHLRNVICFHSITKSLGCHRFAWSAWQDFELGRVPLNHLLNKLSLFLCGSGSNLQCQVHGQAHCFANPWSSDSDSQKQKQWIIEKINSLQVHDSKTLYLRSSPNNNSFNLPPLPNANKKQTCARIVWLLKLSFRSFLLKLNRRSRHDVPPVFR